MKFQTTRYIPKNALPVEEAGLGIVYVYPCRNRYGVIAYVGTACKSAFHYSYKTDAEVDRKVAEFFDGLRQHKARVQQSRATRYEGHNFKSGDIVSNSWGYDQTNVDWYIVTRTTKAYVWLRPINSTLETSESIGPMSGHCAPAMGPDCKPVIAEKGEETKHAAHGEHINFKHGSGSKYTGGTLYESWYA